MDCVLSCQRDITAQKRGYQEAVMDDEDSESMRIGT